ncbi:transcriptional-regulating factor 1 [Gastrophryne carolinensis]
MEDQQIYHSHLASSTHDGLYYQQMQHQANSRAPHHSYDSLDMNVSESSSSSPLLSQDSRDVTLTSVAQVGASTPSCWTNAASDNQTQVRRTPDGFSQSLQWNAPNDHNVGYQISYYSQMDNRAKTSSTTTHKLDSFTQVFSQQNLRIHAMSQGLPQSSLVDADSALRQLLSLKSNGEQQTQPTAVGRYSQVSSQMQQGLTNSSQEHSLQQAQPHFYYEFSQHPTQTQSHSLMQQFGQHMQSNQLLQQQQPQVPYYIQQQHPEPQPLMQDMQQQQYSDQMSQYYLEMQHGMQQSHTHLQQQSYNTKAEHYPQEPANGMQLIQLGSASQYAYQSAHLPRHSYKQNLRPQQQLQQEAGLQKRYRVENQLPILMDSAVGLSCAVPLEGLNQEALGAMSNTKPQQQVLSHDSPYMLSNPGLHHSPSATWPQLVPDAQTISPDSRRLYPDHPEPKTLLTCPMCFKEFKSLPAINGHLRTHSGVRTSTGQKQEEGEKSQCESETLTPIVMPVSVPVKLVPPEPSASLSSKADQLKTCVSDDEMPILTRMTFTPPSSPKVVSSCASSEPVRTHPQSLKPAERPRPQQERRKYRHRPEPLFIPPPLFYVHPSHSGATLYQSQLRSPRIIGETIFGTQELPIYTPPPMLSPVRQGSGLFSRVIAAAHNAHLPLTPLTPTPRILLCRPNSIDGSISKVTPGPGEHIADVEPRINIGSRFQAEIPDLECQSSLKDEAHEATLVWKPWPDLESVESQQQVELFLRMSCSSILPGGGTNLEYALHSLYEANGNIMSALEMLLLRNKPRLKSHPLANYHYAGSDYWTNTEKKSFNKALVISNKDFFHAQKMIKTKTISQCVEYYYTWKKIQHLGRRHRSRLVELSEDNTTSAEDVDDEDLEEKKNEQCPEQVLKSQEILHPAAADGTAVEHLVPRVGSFVCEMGNCGASFCSRQALNGHARIHGGNSAPAKVFSAVGVSRQKSSAQGGYCSVKSSPAHSTTSGETDTTSIFPCKVCGKVFYKIKSRNAHMKTHRQQEEQQKQKAQKASEAAYIADSLMRTLERTTVPADIIFSLDHFNLIKTMEEEFDDDVAQDLEDVLEESEVMHSDLLLDDEDADLLQDAADL